MLVPRLRRQQTRQSVWEDRSTIDIENFFFVSLLSNEASCWEQPRKNFSAIVVDAVVVADGRDVCFKRHCVWLICLFAMRKFGWKKNQLWTERQKDSFSHRDICILCENSQARKNFFFHADYSHRNCLCCVKAFRKTLIQKCHHQLDVQFMTECL